MVVLTRVHMLAPHRDYQPQALDLPPGVSLARFVQRRQTSLVYKDVNMGRRLINDWWAEDDFRFQGAWRGATTFWMPLRRQTAEVRAWASKAGSAPSTSSAISGCVLPSCDRQPTLLGGADGDSPGDGWNPSMDDEREDH